jgi:hypothetical protein
MFLSLKNDSDIQALKYEASVLGQKLSGQTAEKLNQLLQNETIQAKDFIAEFNEIVHSTETLASKNIEYLGTIKEQFNDSLVQFSRLQISLFVVFFLVLFYIYKKLKLKKGFKKYQRLVNNLLERFFALLGYYVPVSFLYLDYVDSLIAFYPSLLRIYPTFLNKTVYFYKTHPQFVQIFHYVYFFGTVLICIGYKIPKPRFIRFHVVRGIMLFSCQSVPIILLNLTQTSVMLTTNQMLSFNMFVFVLNLWWILPSLFQAITHTYPKNKFIREAVEVHLGRDRDDKFKWWDR